MGADETTTLINQIYKFSSGISWGNPAGLPQENLNLELVITSA